jgi:hypothetical protein
MDIPRDHPIPADAYTRRQALAQRSRHAELIAHYLRQRQVAEALRAGDASSMCAQHVHALLHTYPFLVRRRRPVEALHADDRLIIFPHTVRAGRWLLERYRDTAKTAEAAFQRVLLAQLPLVLNAPAEVMLQRLLDLAVPDAAAVAHVLEHGHAATVMTAEERGVLEGDTRRNHPLEGEWVPGRGMATCGDARTRLLCIGARLLERKEEHGLAFALLTTRLRR